MTTAHTKSERKAKQTRNDVINELPFVHQVFLVKIMYMPDGFYTSVFHWNSSSLSIKLSQIVQIERFQ